jgi:hypothetical protein
MKGKRHPEGVESFPRVLGKTIIEATAGREGVTYGKERRHGMDIGESKGLF